MPLILKRIFQKYTPSFVLNYFYFLFQPYSYKKKKNLTLEYYKTLDQNSIPTEIKEGLKFIETHKFSALPFNWSLKYEHFSPRVFFDSENNCFYSMFNAKRMYFPKGYTYSRVVWTMRSVLKEQDKESAHLYTTDDFFVDNESIIVDAGVAEGNFALSVIDNAKKLFLIECNPLWMEALHLTFKPWKDKVVFVDKYLSDTSNDISISIDSLIFPVPEERYFIKMDIEGFEKKALVGMRNLALTAEFLKIDVCTYHNTDDVINIAELIKSYGLNYKLSDSYILYSNSGEIPTFRKALIRAEKGHYN